MNMPIQYFLNFLLNFINTLISNVELNEDDTYSTEKESILLAVKAYAKQEDFRRILQAKYVKEQLFILIEKVNFQIYL
jgi:hypothetical protein